MSQKHPENKEGSSTTARKQFWQPEQNQLNLESIDVEQCIASSGETCLTTNWQQTENNEKNDWMQLSVCWTAACYCYKEQQKDAMPVKVLEAALRGPEQITQNETHPANFVSLWNVSHIKKGYVKVKLFCEWE